VSVGSTTPCKRRNSVIVFVAEEAVMLVALSIVSVVLLAGVIETLDAATCAYPVRFNTGGPPLFVSVSAGRALT
jgi:hypothetical protein